MSSSNIILIFTNIHIYILIFNELLQAILSEIDNITVRMRFYISQMPDYFLLSDITS